MKKDQSYRSGKTLNTVYFVNVKFSAGKSVVLKSFSLTQISAKILQYELFTDFLRRFWFEFKPNNFELQQENKITYQNN